MATPNILMLRMMWRFRGLMAIGVLIVLGHIWVNDAIRAWDAWRQPQIYCDQAHKIPFIPADKCGGMTSCDRTFFNMGQPVPCPTAP
jgi:uncharacterized SAM-binding protein YcdF (DUF218 family)